MPRMRFIGDGFGGVPNGGTTGAWTVGKIYNVSWSNGHTVEVEKDDRGLENGWQMNYFRPVEEDIELVKKVQHGDIYTLLTYLYHRHEVFPDDMWGGVSIRSALESALRILELEGKYQDLHNILLGFEEE